MGGWNFLESSISMKYMLDGGGESIYFSIKSLKIWSYGFENWNSKRHAALCVSYYSTTSKFINM